MTVALVRLDSSVGGDGRSAVSKAQVYYSLKKMLTLGHVVVTRNDAESAGPRRETYRITASGRHAMSEEIASPDWPHDRPPMSFTMWLMVLGHAEASHRAMALARYREYSSKKVSHQQSIIARTHRTTGEQSVGEIILLASAKHAMEILRMEQEMLDAIEPMLGR